MIARVQRHTLIIAAALLLTGVNLVAAYNLYQRPSRVDSNQSVATGTGQATASQEVIAGLRTLLQQGQMRRTSYQVIADKNLFSSERKAWQPPQSKEETEQEEVVVSKARRTDVILYGVFTIGSKTGAMLEFPTLEQALRKQTMFAGDSVAEESGRRAKSYTILKIEPDQVTVRDQNDIVFSVGLYDEKRNRRRSAANPKTAVSVVSEQNSSASSAVVAGTAGSAEVEKVVKERQAKARMEEQVKKGEMRKVTTPFGTAYIKNDSPQPAKKAE